MELIPIPASLPGRSNTVIVRDSYLTAQNQRRQAEMYRRVLRRQGKWRCECGRVISANANICRACAEKVGEE